MRVLRVTSPMMRGEDVRSAQRRLVRSGHLAAGGIDGVFGPITGSACVDAKWELGYADRNCSPTYGAALDAFLSGSKKPSRVMRRRAQKRKGSQEKHIGERAAETMAVWARAGWKESPAGSNYVAQLASLGARLGVSSYYSGMRYPWCAYAVFIAALNHGSDSAKAGFAGRFNVLYCPSISLASGQGQFGMRRVTHSQIKKGTVVLFDWQNDGTMDHIGIALGRPGQKVAAANMRFEPSHNEVVCVEGNTSVGNDSNGGMVMVRIRRLSQIKNPFELS